MSTQAQELLVVELVGRGECKEDIRIGSPDRPALDLREVGVVNTAPPLRLAQAPAVLEARGFQRLAESPGQGALRSV